MSQPQLVEVNRYGFSAQVLACIKDNAYASGKWPLVYILSDGESRRAYIGETTDTLTRMNTHLKHEHKKTLTTLCLISSERFNKSATLDIESALIKYMAADNRFSLMNGNLGLVDHNYYQKDELYSKIFHETWDKLRAEGLTSHSLESINNSDIFKYSPYKSLSFDQRQSLLAMMRALLDPPVKHLVVEGGAGTGKSVLAIFLFKLLNSDDDDLNLHEFSEEENELRDVLAQLKQVYNKPSMALVVPMASFRNTLKKAFKHVAGLHPNMVISPSELAQRRYDIVLVDESHRLRQRVNLGAYYGAFDKACATLGLDKHTCSEVDWVCKQADKAIFFYDQNQSIKPSDANPADFQRIKSSHDSKVMALVSQFRVQGGQHYVRFIDDILNTRLTPNEKFSSNKYEFALFDSMEALVKEIGLKNQRHGLSRMIAGYAWPWASKNKPDGHDIEIGEVRLRWNSKSIDWINTSGSEHEVGCIHTTQGYDLNYTGVIFGKEIRYDKARGEIVIDKDNYHDQNGKQSIKTAGELKRYILNIYKTIMLRGIKGTFVYACDDDLREYLGRHIPMHASTTGKFTRPVAELIPYVNAVPFYDLQAAAGGFSELQHATTKDWVAIPDDINAAENLFACRVIGESMNRIIPNGATCLFRLDPGGSRNGKIVLVDCTGNHDDDAGSRYTVKEYESTKIETEEGWHHQTIRLKPRSTDPDIKALELTDDQTQHYRVVAEFIRVIG
jgi:DUF2075 family protein/predicted GIY-YIG superfamily endonuclease